MANLDSHDYEAIRNALYKKGGGKDLMKAMASLPSSDQLKAVFQAVEDVWESTQMTFKSAIDAAYGQTTTVELAKEIMKAWASQKVRKM